MKLLLKIALLALPCSALSQRITISGFVKEERSQEPLPGVNVFIPGSPYGTETNAYGFYALTLPSTDSATIAFSFVGYRKGERRVSLRSNLTLNVLLAPENQLSEVVIKSQSADAASDVQMSKVGVSIQQIKKIPAFFAEKDVLKVLQLMPGVQKGTEGQTGLYVRGGGPDQNLIILDDAVVYNANHLFGFFSVFNSDAIKSVELTKGGFPARYGGRLSSVVEMTMKEGSKEKLHGEGGLGLLASRLTLEGPIRKDKSSFLVSGRRTYIDVIAGPIIARQQHGKSHQTKPGYFFYDLNGKMNFDVGSRDNLYVSGYFGRDKLYVRERSKSYAGNNGLDWGNATGTMRWNHLFSQKLFANTSLIYSSFDFGAWNEFTELDTTGVEVRKSGTQYNSRIRDLSIKTDFDYYPLSGHAMRLGVQGTLHRSTPSAITVKGSEIGAAGVPKAPVFESFETALYAEDVWQVTKAIKLNAGMRLSTFNTQGKTYVRPEPRAAAAVALSNDLSMKVSYAQMNQYVHLLSNTGIGLPTDLWVPATKKVVPQKSRQIAAGLARTLNKPELTVTLEGYYKKMNHILSYKQGASFINVNGANANELNWQDNVTSGLGWSYGSELLIQKKAGRLSGWVGYTLSWTRWKFADINLGKSFYPRYDRRHDIAVVGIYDLNKRITLSANWVFGTGNALTLPVSRYMAVSERSGIQSTDNSHLFSTQVTEYADRSNFRAGPFHRLDVAVQFRKVKRRYERTWEVAVYNAYNRKNPFFYDVNYDQNSKGVLTKFSLFPIMPSFGYNFKF